MGQGGREIPALFLSEVNPGSRDVYYRFGSSPHSAKGLYNRVEHLQEILDRDPDDLEAHLRMMGLIYGELKNFPSAIEQLEKVRVARPREVRIRDYLAYLYESSKEYEKALHEYQEILTPGSTTNMWMPISTWD